ncbi:hypothetical protein ACFL0C_02275 [Patescibacteria group bacterium]
MSGAQLTAELEKIGQACTKMISEKGSVIFEDFVTTHGLESVYDRKIFEAGTEIINPGGVRHRRLVNHANFEGQGYGVSVVFEKRVDRGMSNIEEVGIYRFDDIENPDFTVLEPSEILPIDIPSDIVEKGDDAIAAYLESVGEKCGEILSSKGLKGGLNGLKEYNVEEGL